MALNLSTQPVLIVFSNQVFAHQKPIVGTPQQNGLAERKHRHLLDTARALRLHAGLPKSF